MSFLEPSKTDVQKAMQAVARDLAQKADLLSKFADSFDEVSDEEFVAYLGDQYTGAGSFRQWSEQVHKAVMPRPSDTKEFDRVLSVAFARAQREVAVKPAEEV